MYHIIEWFFVDAALLKENNCGSEPSSNSSFNSKTPPGMLTFHIILSFLYIY